MAGKPTLWLDTSTMDTSLALVDGDQTLAQRTAEASALDFIFEELADMFLETGVRFPDIESIHYVCGPGSSLGLRIACMALSSWKTAFPSLELRAAHTLPIYAALHAQEPSSPKEFQLLAQHRKDTWYHIQSTQECLTKMNALGDGQVAQLEGNLYHLRQRKFATPPPPGSQPLQPNLKALPAVLQDETLFQTVENPTVFPETTPTFKKWIPQRHKKAVSN